MQLKRSRMRLPWLVAVWLLLICLRSYACAADISAPMLNLKAFQANNKIDILEPSDPVRCDLVLDGVIAEGDAVKLKQEFEDNSNINGSGIISYFLCLRSDGGDATEALKIARFILDNQRPSIATVIEDGETCASACALIFLAGNAPVRQGGSPARYLHPRGQLLFHSTRLDLTDFSDQQILGILNNTSNGGNLKDNLSSWFYGSALQTEQSIISTFQVFQYEQDNLGDRWVRPSLFLEMFAQDPNELLCIDNVDAAGRWGIDVYGYTEPKTLTNKNYADACYNTYYWRRDEFVADADLTEGDAVNEKGIKTTTNNPKANNGLSLLRRTAVPFQTAFSKATCVIDEKGKAGGSTSEIDISFSDVTADSAEPNPLAFFPASTLLSDLPGVRRQAPAPPVPGRVPTKFLNQPNRLMNGCSLRRISVTSSDECQTKCAADVQCVGYSYNKFNQMCEFKFSATALRIDPMWVSGTPVGQPAQQSSRAKHMGSLSIAQDEVLDGTVIDTAQIANTSDERDEPCVKKCETDKSCVAVEIDHGTSTCKRFSGINGLDKAGSPNFASDYIKTQH